eukprot:scaffold15494_cov50-Phaeocystis_antarctica.AAC.1
MAPAGMACLNRLPCASSNCGMAIVRMRAEPPWESKGEGGRTSPIVHAAKTLRHFIRLYYIPSFVRTVLEVGLCPTPRVVSVYLWLLRPGPPVAARGP